MKSKANRIISIILALLMFVSVVPMFSISTSAMEKRTYEVDTWSELVSALISQVDADITVTGDIYSEYNGEYSTYSIEGKNTLNLNGYSVEFNAKINEKQHDMYNKPRSVMFRVLKDAELIITDSSELDLGSISFDAHMVAWRDFQRSAIRDIFEIEGKLTLEAGTIKAGRNKEQWVTALATQDGLYTGNVNQVIFGTPFTVLNGGELTINGGRIISYGNVTLGDYGLENYEGKCVRVNKGGKCTVNGGDFLGYAGADIFDSRTDEEHLFVNAGTFTTYKMDDVLLNTIVTTSDAPKGYLRIPDYSWADQSDNLEIVVGNVTHKLGDISDSLSLFSKTEDTVFYNANCGFGVLTPIPTETDRADKGTILESVYLNSPELNNVVFECKANNLSSYFTSKGYYTVCDMIISRDHTTLYSGNGKAVKLSSVANQAGKYAVTCYSTIYGSNNIVAAREGHVYTIEVKDGKLVTSMNATITEPVAGVEPSYTANHTIEGIYIQDVDWAKKTGENEFTFLKDGEKFEQGATYECSIAFIAEEGVYFAEDIWAAINGMDVEAYVSNGGKKLSLYGQFECTAENSLVNILKANVTKPVAGEFPDATVIPLGDGYKTTDIDWSSYNEIYDDYFIMGEGETFEAGKTYECAVQFETLDGYTFPEYKEDIKGYVNDIQGVISSVYYRDKAYVTVRFTVPEENQLSVIFTSESKAETGKFLEVDLEKMAELSDVFMDAYFNDNVKFQWFLNGSKIDGATDVKYNIPDGYAGDSIYVEVFFGESSIESDNLVITQGVAVTGLLGDADENGKVNVKDATTIQKHVADILKLSESGMKLADADGNAKVNVRDATAIQKFVADIETGFPIGQLVA